MSDGFTRRKLAEISARPNGYEYASRYLYWRAVARKPGDTERHWVCRLIEPWHASCWPKRARITDKELSHYPLREVPHAD